MTSKETRLRAIFVLAIKHYRPELDVANEDKNDPNYPASFVTQKSVDARRRAIILINENDVEFKTYLNNEETPEGFFVKTPDNKLALYQPAQLQDLFNDGTLDSDYKHLLSVVVLNQFVNYRAAHSPKFN